MAMTGQGTEAATDEKRGDSYTYLAVGSTNTTLYTLNPYLGLVAKVENAKPYAAGYDALALRTKDGKLYAMKRQSDTMLTIDAATGKVLTETELHGMPDRGGSSYTNGDFEPDGDTYIIASGPNQPAVRVNVATDPPTVTNLHPAGAGGWYDWAYHPKDGRLYAVDGDDGSLIHIDPSANPLKKVLAKGCFPKSESAKTGERGLYSAVFFTTAGHLYAVDTAGNVNKLDLTGSTQSKPVTADDLRDAKSSRVGGGKLKLNGLQVRDSAGQVLHQEIKEQYDWIDAKIAIENGHPYETDDPAPGWVYNYSVTLIARQTDVHRWRVTFELPANWLIRSWGPDVDINYGEGRQAYIEPKEAGLIPAGKSQDFLFGLWAPKKDLQHLQAVRLS
ncbi:hypothetical protein L0U85_19910 [Glycomyces sp. L485]|uniref:DUF6923 family protein n=1 Tax=Glycomyces sp. L485 TaxID=2909235 RepID=UPI001F4A861E|nr:hypothetical protein [Glycomyces sp. L485]MCH7233103.1 hypothetical protein [Glycomyces sp. L485]